jgi:hypothetical protein
MYTVKQLSKSAISDSIRSQVYLYSNQLAERGVRKMEKKNVVFTKDGARVGVKEIRAEDYADKTQRCVSMPWRRRRRSRSSANALLIPP